MKKILPIFLMTSLGSAMNYSKLDSVSDSFAERIRSNISTSFDIIDERLGFSLSKSIQVEEDKDLFQKKNKTSFKSYEHFLEQCSILHEISDDPIKQEEIVILVKEVNKKLGIHLPRKDDAMETAESLSNSQDNSFVQIKNNII